MYTRPRNGRAYTAVGFRKAAPKVYVAAPGGYRPRTYRAYRRTPYRSYQVTRGYPRGTQGEFKSVDTTIAVNSDTTGAIVLLNGIARGDDINERTGRQVTLRSVQLSLTFGVVSGTGIDQYQRYMVVLDHQPNGAALAITDVLDGVTVTHQRNLNNRKRFTVLMDKHYSLNASAESGSRRVSQMYRRLNTVVDFNGGDAGTIADITTNSVYFISIGSVAAGATAGSVIGTARIRYTDM